MHYEINLLKSFNIEIEYTIIADIFGKLEREKVKTQKETTVFYHSLVTFMLPFLEKWTIQLNAIILICLWHHLWFLKNTMLLLKVSVRNNSLQTEKSRARFSVYLLLHHSSALNGGCHFFLETFLHLRRHSSALSIFHSVFSPMAQTTAFHTFYYFHIS